MRIAIADDDVPVANFIAGLLRSEHHEVRVIRSCEASTTIVEEHTDLLIMDVDVAGMGGHGILRLVRAAKRLLPVLVLTAGSRVEDRVETLDCGADDYMTKPFVPSELAARVRALLRRNSPPFQPVLRARDVELDRIRRVVSRNGREIGLTQKEFGLLEYLMLNAGQDVSRSSIIRDVWKLSSETSTNVVDVYVNYLRRKLQADAGDVVIHTVRGAGYRIETRPVPNGH